MAFVSIFIADSCSNLWQLYLFRFLHHTKNPNARASATSRRTIGTAITAELVLLDSDASSLIPSYVLSMVDICLVGRGVEDISSYRSLTVEKVVISILLLEDEIVVYVVVGSYAIVGSYSVVGS